jgi:chromate reductase, NAD(P)H dehydrogenase (quinone)
MRVLAISGSLRAASMNSALLRATARIAPPGVEVLVFDGIGQLPLFNPDLESADPAAVAILRTQIIAADALLIASPEYAHGVTSAIKNALDWMVGNESFVNKPVALFNASPRAVHAQAALRETLTTMSARVIAPACITVPILGSGLDEFGIQNHAPFRSAIVEALRTLQQEILSARAGAQSSGRGFFGI